MYLKRVVLRDVKCFEELELDFGEPGNIRRWTALLGRNGLGKSTLLQAIAAALAGPVAVRELLPTADGWVRDQAPYGTIDAELLRTKGDSAPGTGFPSEQVSHRLSYIVTGKPEQLPDSLREEYYSSPVLIDWTGEGDTKDRAQTKKSWNRLKKYAFSETSAGWAACGYGPFRRLSGGSQEAEKIVARERRSARFITLFKEGAAITNASEWLKELHNTAREGEAQNERALNCVRALFNSNFFPEPVDLHVSAKDVALVIDGRPQQFEQVSDGYRAMLAMGVDILRWLIRAFPDTADPTQEPAVVVIDELDAHLHPTWQHQIGYWLLEKFPKVQFIVATHSPFLAQVAEDAGNVVLSRSVKVLRHSTRPAVPEPATEHAEVLSRPYLVKENDRVFARPEAEVVHTWRVDQILTDLFQLRNTYSPDVDRKLQRYHGLFLKQHREGLDAEEVEEFARLRLWHQSLPIPLEEPRQRCLLESLQHAVDEHAEEIRSLL